MSVPEDLVTLSYPDDFCAREIAAADQRHQRVVDAVDALVADAAAFAGQGFDGRSASTQLHYTSTRVCDLVAGVASPACCRRGCDRCQLPAALMLIGELALRAGAAMVVGAGG